MLRNADGSIYQLESPNPIMNTQNSWKEQFVLHNMIWDAEKAEDKNKNFLSKEGIQDTFISSLEKTKPEITIESIEPVKIEEQKIEDKPKLNVNIQKTFIHCLPATLKEKTDTLYGDTYKTIQYDNPTSFEGVVLKQEDLFVEIWSDYEIGIGSIIYPKSNIKRWWRIQKKEEKAGGWIFFATPSDFQPSFET